LLYNLDIILDSIRQKNSNKFLRESC